MRTWLFITNPFLNAVKNNFKKAVKISTYHDAQLKSHDTDAFFAPIATAYHVLHLELVNAYATWLAQGGTQKGSTLDTNQLLLLLVSNKIPDWEYTILGVYKKGTPQFLAIFPRGKKPFSNGSIESRVTAVKQLNISLNNIAALAEVKTAVDAFLNQLLTSREIQLGNKGMTENLSTAITHINQVAMTEMHSNLGLLISHFKNDPIEAGEFFDLETIRNHDQIIFKDSVAPTKERNIMKHTFAKADGLKLTNNGTVDLQFYLAPTNNAVPASGQTVVSLAPEEFITIIASDLGDVANLFLNVYNTDLNQKGHCTIELL